MRRADLVTREPLRGEGRRPSTRTFRAPVELDDAAASTLGTQIREAFDGGAQWVTVDFSDCTSCGSSCIEVLIAARKHAERLGRGFAVLHPPPMLVRMGEVLGASEFLDLPGL